MTRRNMAEIHQIDGRFLAFLLPARLPAFWLTRRALAVSDCDTHESISRKPIRYSSASHRPSSTSARSSRSRITLVECDAELDVRLDTPYGTTTKAKEFSWWDHLLGVFCIRRRSSIILTTPTMSTDAEVDEVGEMTAEAHLAFVDPSYRLTTPLHGFYLSMFFQLKETSQGISYPRKPNVHSTPETFRETWYLRHLSPTF